MVSCQSRLGGQVRSQQKKRSLFLPMPKIKGLCQEGHPASYTKSNPYDLQRRPPRGTADRKEKQNKTRSNKFVDPWLDNQAATTTGAPRCDQNTCVTLFISRCALFFIFFSCLCVCVCVCFISAKP